MPGQTLYERYKGHRATFHDSIGIICGYCDTHMIMAVVKGPRGWLYNMFGNNTYLSHIHNPKGYFYVRESELLTISSLPMSNL